ncbi:MAG: tetratricopeptide repeat protein [Elusimicrobiota bacterium]
MGINLGYPRGESGAVRTAHVWAAAALLAAAGLALLWVWSSRTLSSDELKVAVLRQEAPRGEEDGYRLLKVLDVEPAAGARALPSEVNRLDGQGLDLLRELRYDEAVRRFDDSLGHVPDNPRALANRGTAFLGLGELEKALQDYAAAMDREPALKPLLGKALGKAFLKRGQQRIEAKEADGAGKDLETALKLDPKNALAHAELASVALLRQRFDDCLRHLDQAIGSDPDVPGVYGNRGVCLSALGRYKEAIKDLDHAIALNPGQAEIYATRAGARYWTQDYQAALDDALKAVELAPKLEKTVRPLIQEIKRNLK